MQANTGTWDGPAPRGNLNQAEGRAASHSQASTSQPDSVMLPGGAQLPLIGFGTDKIQSADVIRLGPESTSNHIQRFNGLAKLA